MDSPSTSTTDTTTPSIDDLCTQLESLMLDEQEEVINYLHVTWGELYSQLVWSTWRRKNAVEGIYLDEVAAEEVKNREENYVGDEESCSFPEVHLYILWSTCVHKLLRGD